MALTFATRFNAVPVLIGITDVPVVTETTDNHSPEHAQKLETPCEASGLLVEADEKDWYTFAARRGEVVYVELIGERMPVTMGLGALALVFAVALSIPLGVAAALRPMRCANALISG